MRRSPQRQPGAIARRLSRALALAGLLGAGAAGPASAAVGDLTQLPGTLGCLSSSGAAGCGPAVGLNGASSVAVSPDGRSAYATSFQSDAVAVFDRAADGTLTQKPGVAGCVSETGSSGACTDGRALDFASGVAVSPDGANVYVAAATSDAVAVFDRAADGTLTQKAGLAGCVADTAAAGWMCAGASRLDGVSAVSVSPDGASVYLAAGSDNAIVVLDRAPGGALTQKAAPAGCVSSNGFPECTNGRGLFSASAVAVSPDGKSLYATALNDGVALFDRATNGTLTQKPGAAGCITEDGTGAPGASACTVGTAIGSPTGLAISPDQRHVYATARGTDALLSFDRATSGALVQKPGTAGCVSDTGSGGACAGGRGLTFPLGVTVSPDGRSVYAAASGTSNAISAFDRADSGVVTQKAGPAGCVRAAGSSGACAIGRGLGGASGVTVSPDGLTVYASATISNAVSVFAREPVPPPAAPAPPPSAPPPPATLPAPGPSTPPSPPPFAAKLEVKRASVLRSQRRLSVLAPITGRASGAVRVRFRAAGTTTRFTAKVDAANRRVLINRRIPAKQARKGTGILTLTYPGDADTQPQEVRLRAASVKARLVADRPRISSGRLTAAGELSKRARGVVRVQVLFEPPGLGTTVLAFQGRIKNGRYRISEKLSAATVAAIVRRRGVVHSYTLFTGYERVRMRGEMRSFQLAAAP